MNTLFIGQNRIDLVHVDSTNKYLANHENLTDLPEGTAVTASFQSKGKGQRERVWYSESGLNVTMSVLLRPKFVKANDYFILNKGVTLAVLNTIEYFTNQEVLIKWPNDVIVNKKKIAGLLVELNWRSSACQNAIVGLGLNVNQTEFKNLPNATSLKELGCNVELEDVYSAFFKFLEFQYLMLRKMEWDSVLMAYNERLWGRNEVMTFEHNGEVKSGVLKGVSNDGRLRIVVDGKEFEFANGEISLQYN